MLSFTSKEYHKIDRKVHSGSATPDDLKLFETMQREIRDAGFESFLVADKRHWTCAKKVMSLEKQIAAATTDSRIKALEVQWRDAEEKLSVAYDKLCDAAIPMSAFKNKR